MRLFALPLAAALAAPLAAPLAAFAQQAPSAIERPGATNETLGSYIFAGYHTADDWQFVLGPRDSARMVMRLAKRTEEGAAAFLCRRAEGAMTFAVAIGGLRAAKGDAVEMRVAVGQNAHPLRMEVRDEPAEGEAAVFEVEGQAAADIISAMGMVPTGTWAELKVNAPSGEGISFPVPEPRDIAQTAGRVCDGWSRLAAAPRVTVGGESLALPGLPPR